MQNANDFFGGKNIKIVTNKNQVDYFKVKVVKFVVFFMISCMIHFVTKIMVPLCHVFGPDDRVWFAVFKLLCRHFLTPQGILIMLM